MPGTAHFEHNKYTFKPSNLHIIFELAADKIFFCHHQFRIRIRRWQVILKMSFSKILVKNHYFSSEILFLCTCNHINDYGMKMFYRIMFHCVRPETNIRFRSVLDGWILIGSKRNRRRITTWITKKKGYHCNNIYLGKWREMIHLITNNRA